MQIQIEIDEAGVRLLNEIKEKAGLNDYRAVFDNGIALLSWAVRQRADGKVVAAVDEGTHSYKEVQLPA
ncbi:MAG: hypothetical protein ABSA78_19290 [Candidatus Sulfotelmatobacter sp.]|jgi:hypothetical protein